MTARLNDVDLLKKVDLTAAVGIAAGVPARTPAIEMCETAKVRGLLCKHHRLRSIGVSVVTMTVAVVMMAVRMTAKQEETAAIMAIVDRLNLAHA